MVERGLPGGRARRQIAQVAKRASPLALGHEFAHLLGDGTLDVAESETHSHTGVARRLGPNRSPDTRSCPLNHLDGALHR